MLSLSSSVFTNEITGAQKVRRLSYSPTVHSIIKFIVKAAPSPTFPFTKHLGYTLQSSWPLDASGSRFGSKVLETQLDMDRLSLDTYPPAHKTTSSAGATTIPGELSPILRGQRHVTPPEQQERTQQAGFLSMATQVFIYSQHVPSSRPPKRPLCLVRTVSIK